MKLAGLLLAIGLSAGQAQASNVVLKLSKDAKITKAGVVRPGEKLSGEDQREYAEEADKLDLTALKETGTTNLVVGGYEMNHTSGKKEKFSLTLKLWTTSDAVASASGLVYSQASTSAGYLTDLPVIHVSSRSYALTKDLYAKINANQTIECVIEAAEIVTVLTGEASANQLKIKSAKCQ